MPRRSNTALYGMGGLAVVLIGLLVAGQALGVGVFATRARPAKSSVHRVHYYHK